MSAAAAKRVLITDHAWPDVQVESAILQAAGLQVLDAPTSDEATLCSLAVEALAIMTCFGQVTSRVIDSARGLQVVARFGVGVDNIAVETASARGIPVTYVPDYCVAEVAEHALALLLSLARGIARYDRSVKARGWDLSVAAPLRRLEGQTLGLIGYGRIGSRLGAKARGLGMRVLANGPRVHAGTSDDVVAVELDELLAESDFVSLHVPLKSETRGLVDESVLRRMKSSAFLINTARGGLVDTVALTQALREGWIAGSGARRAARGADCVRRPAAGPRQRGHHTACGVLFGGVAGGTAAACGAIGRRRAGAPRAGASGQRGCAGKTRGFEFRLIAHGSSATR